MLTKRIIPCLDVKDGRVVKGVSFLNLRDADDPVEVAVVYACEGADELCFLDITASHENLKTYLPNGRAALQLIARSKAETHMLLGDLEEYDIHKAVSKTEKLPGEIAEVGVFRGGSAKLIAETSAKPVHLFDTFEGHPELSREDRPEQFRKGDYSASLENVERYLASYPHVRLYKGLFPATAGPIEEKRFSFVHLDVDLYQPTLDSLAFFYPRLSRGAIVIGHDYRDIRQFHDSGVEKAFDEFFADKPEVVIELLDGSQCLVVKT